MIEDNTFDAENEGFHNHISFDFSGAAPENANITGNTFNNVDDGGTAIGSTEEVDGLDISDNTFENNRNSIGIGEGASDVTIKDNVFTGGEFYLTNREESLDLISDVLATNDFDRGVGVSDTNQDTKDNFDGLLQWISTDLQSGVDTAAEDSSIEVVEGTYEENLDVTVTNLELSGPNVEIHGDDDRADPATIEGVVNLSADGIVIDGFDVSTPPADENQESEAILVSNTPDDVIVRNNVVTGFEDDEDLVEWTGVEGINAFGGDSEEALTRVHIVDNRIDTIANTDNSAGPAGISIQGNVVDAVVRENVVRDIGLEQSNWAHGITIRETVNHDVVPENVNITGNDIANVRPDPDSDLDGVGVGVEADGSDYVVTENTISGNTLGLEIKEADDETVVTQNNIVDNDVMGVSNTDDATVDATPNWWGSASGPTTDENPDGTGAEVSGDVEFSPWLDAPFDDGGEEIDGPGIKHSTVTSGATGTGPDAERFVTELLTASPENLDEMAFSGDVDRSIEIQHVGSDDALTITPDDDDQYDVRSVQLSLFNGDGTVDPDPTVRLRTSEHDDVIQLDVDVEGDEDIFTDRDSTFEEFELALIEDGDEVATTNERLIGIAYASEFEQDDTEGEVTVTHPRDSEVDEDWDAEFLLFDDGEAHITTEVDNVEGDEEFEVTIDLDELDDGVYTPELLLSENEDADASE